MKVILTDDIVLNPKPQIRWEYYRVSDLPTIEWEHASLWSPGLPFVF